MKVIKEKRIFQASSWNCKHVVPMAAEADLENQNI